MDSKVGMRSSVIEKIKKILAFPYFLIKLLLICHREKPKCIHAHAMFYCGLAGLIASHVFKIPLVYEIRSIWYENSNAKQPRILAKLAKFFEKFVINRSNAVVAISLGIKNEYKKTRKNIFIIRNAINSEKIIKPQLKQSITKFAYIGSLIELEGLYGTIEAFSKLKKRGYEYEFHVFGDGPIFERLLKYSKQTESPSFFHGEINHDEINKSYSEIDCIINFRNDEKVARLVTPLKPLEAILFGKPLICSDVQGYQEILGGKDHAHFVTSGDVNELVDKIIYVASGLNNKEIRNVTNSAQEFIKRERTWESNIDKYSHIYSNVKYGKKL